MPDVERLWTAIPVGEEKAESATEIWRRYDLGARSSLQHNLIRLAAEGCIKRISRPLPQGSKVHLYYRVSE
jgi:predicted transcriptional regulator